MSFAARRHETESIVAKTLEIPDSLWNDIFFDIFQGLAERHGGLRRGDQLLAVNGTSVEGENHERAVELLKQAQGTVTLVVRYAPHILEQMESRFERHHKS